MIEKNEGASEGVNHLRKYIEENPMSESFLIQNISRLVTCESGPGREGPLGVISDGCVRVEDGKIAWVGALKKLPQTKSCERTVDAKGGVVMPGLVDCHTHIVHGGFRCDEFDLRSKGKTYKEIAAAGGGIMSTVKATRAATFEELLKTAKERVAEAISFGVTAIEVKTGYGLDLKTEMKMLDVIAALGKKTPARVSGTFLGAHVVPVEYKDRRGEYVKLVSEEMIEKAAAKGAAACDVFVEEGAFSTIEARKIAKAAKSNGLAMRLHVDQFGDGGGGALAAELHALSADHLDHTSEDGMRAMAKAGVSAVVLPGASFFAGRGHFPNVRKMFASGLNVAIASDYNPGTNPSLDLWLMATIAVTQMGFSCDEAILGITKNAATAFGSAEMGAIAVGKKADMVILDTGHEHFPIYRYGRNFVKKVFIGGKIVHER